MKYKRAVIFANGDLRDQTFAKDNVANNDLIIAADGGTEYCRLLDIVPDYIIGDLDSIEQNNLGYFQSKGSKVIQHPEDKDYTDLELSVLHAQSCGVNEIIVFGSLGYRWDQSVANILLLASSSLGDLDVRLVQADQMIRVLRPGKKYQINGNIGDIVSLIPLSGDVSGISTNGLHYPLNNEVLRLGSTRGISNIIDQLPASVETHEGVLLCIIQTS